jgi:hypothetical protein
MAPTMTARVPIVYRESPLIGPHLPLGRTTPGSLYARGMTERRIVGSHFNRQGKPKRGYIKEEVAKAEAARFGMTYYRCDVCEKFHLTSK